MLQRRTLLRFGHITEVWQGGAAEVPQSDAMDVDEDDLTMEARQHAHPPLRGPRPARVAPCGLLRTLSCAHSRPLPCVNSALVLPLARMAARRCVS